MPLPDPFAPPPSDAVVAGTGRLTLDVIVRGAGAPRSQAGGTCGNVLANLAFMGWRAYPVADLGDDDPGHRFAADLARFGVHLDLIRHLRGQQTPVIVHHIRQTDNGAVHSFSSRCPFCNHRLRYYEPIPTDDIRSRLPMMPPCRAFFFDRDSEGSLLLARHCAGQGALIVHEPNYAGKESLLAETLRVAHVLKFSRDRLPDLAGRSLEGPLMLIETRGSEGLRYLDRRHVPARWHSCPALPVSVVRDAGGSGDWTTAGLIHLVARSGLEGFRALSAEELRQAVQFGQALGAWNCAFEGARGGVYRVDRDRWHRDVQRILAGEVFDPGAGCDEDTHDVAGRFCPACAGIS
jgi:fructokinase